ncbi:MAG: hypothetical protein ACKVS9_00480 [Phycisphaerae bacterium]
MTSAETIKYAHDGKQSASGFRASGRFWMTVGILLLSAATMQSVAAAFGTYFAKLPLPLNKPLYQLDPSKLGPEYGLHREQPEKLHDDMIENLGTNEILNWALVDHEKSPSDTTYAPKVFVTYHTGKPDMVPHNPRECMVAAGFSLVGDSTIVVPVKRPDGTMVDIPIALLIFEAPARGIGGGVTRLPVLFFFEANGKFVTTRSEVRLATQSLLDRYSYYAKLEIHFSDERFARFPSAEEAQAAIGPLLNKLMPILWADHFQDWQTVKTSKQTAGQGV